MSISVALLIYSHPQRKTFSRAAHSVCRDVISSKTLDGIVIKSLESRRLLLSNITPVVGGRRGTGPDGSQAVGALPQPCFRVTTNACKVIVYFEGEHPETRRG